MSDAETLARMPDYQRAAVVFIDMQLAHLEAQAVKLREARLLLLGCPPIDPTQPQPLPIPLVARRVRGTVAWDAVADAIEAYLRAAGEASPAEIARGIGESSARVSNVLYATRFRGRFDLVGHGRYRPAAPGPAANGTHPHTEETR